jgi:hypothetical protein
MKVMITIREAIVDSEIAMQAFQLLEGKVEFIEKQWARDDDGHAWKFTKDVSESDISIKPINQSVYAQAVLALNDDN